MASNILRVLAVEDNPADLRLLKELLSEASSRDFEVVGAETLNEANLLLTTSGFEIVLLDLNLPDSTGLEGIDKILATPAAPPVIVLTGLDNQETGLQALTRNAQDYLIKGKIDSDMLVRSIRYAIRRDQAEKAVRQMNAELEQRVAEQTAEIRSANERLEQRVSTRTAELQEANESLRAARLAAMNLMEDTIRAQEELKKVNRMLRESEERLARAQEIAHLGSWELDLLENQLSWSDEVYRIFGLQPQEFGATYEAFLEAIHPDDRAAVDAAYSGSIREGRDTYEIEHRVVKRSSGEVRIVHEKCEHLRDAGGQIIRSVGMVHDVTERVQAEEALREARDELEIRVQERTKELELANTELLYEIYEREEVERQLRVQTTAMKAAANGIIITNPEGEILWSNPALTHMTGYTEDELIGQNMRIFNSGQHAPDHYRQMWEAILAGETWQGEMINRRKDGSFYTESQTIASVRDERGQLSHFIAIKQDITGHKQMEAALELERVRLKNILDTIPDGVYIVNQEFDIEYANPVIEREFGPVDRRKCYAYFHDLSEPCPWCENEEVLSGMVLTGERTYDRNNKSYEIFDAPFANSDGSVSKLKILHDITQRKKMELELEQNNRELQAATDAERKQRQAAETLRAATQALAQSLDLDTVLNTLLRHITALVDTDIASVGFVEDETRLVSRVTQGSGRKTDIEPAPLFPIDPKTDFFFQKVAASHTCQFISDATRDPDWIDYPGMEPIRSWLGVPILVNEKVIGVVLLGNTQPDFFTREQAQSAEALVSQAAVAIQNAWLFEQVRAGRERLQLLSRRLVEIQESERRYIARELHDQAGQSLTSLILDLGQLEKGEAKNGDKQVQTGKLKLLASDILEDLHRLAVNLRPASLDHLGLVAALQQLATISAENERLEVKFKALGFSEHDRFPAEIETTLYRIVQEALTNVTRHAKATRADVILEQRGDTLILIVEDNGIGFDTTFPPNTDHLGLIGIRERTEMLGGNLTVESIIGSGTILVVEVPNADSHLAGG